MLLVAAFIILFIILIALISNKFNIPLILIALTIGIVFGSDVTGIIYFDNAKLSQQIANLALIFILFAGGYGTKSINLKPVFRVTMLLATGGVLLTAVITAMFFHFFSGWSFLNSLLISTILSSTDAAAVFSILKTRAIKKRVTSITEIESAANDPMAILATIFILNLIVGITISTSFSILMLIWQLIGGIIFGGLIGIIGIYLFKKIRNLDVGYFYLLLIGLILLSFSLADLFNTSGMISAFFAGFIMGNQKLPYKYGLTSFTETLSFIANVGLFILLGLLVFPSNFTSIWFLGVILFLIITFIGRPITIFICTLLTRLTVKEKIFISWSGIRGAVPIVLATYPAAVGIDKQHQIFNIVFFAVTLSILVQGSTIGKLADFLKLTFKNKKTNKQMMKLVTIHDTNYELIEIFINEDIYQGQCQISHLYLPAGTTITMINRDNMVIAPAGNTIIYPGDILSVLIDANNIEIVTNKILNKFSKK